MAILDDVVKGVKKFGSDVIEGAKNGPGMAAQIKKGAILKSNGNSFDLERTLNKRAGDIGDIIKKGRKDISSLSEEGQKTFNKFNKYADENGVIKNYHNIAADDMQKIRNMSDADLVNNMDDLKRITGHSMNSKPAGMSNEDWAKQTRETIDTLIDKGNKSVGRSIGDFGGGGIYGSYNSYKNMEDGKKSIMSAIKQGHSKLDVNGNQVLDKRKVAGTAATTVGATALGNRVLRDEYGEIDVPVVPFI